MKRRFFIKAFPFVGAAAVLPVAAIEHETITDKLDRLTSELAEALAEYQGGKFQALIEPGRDGDVTFVRLAAKDRRAFHLAEFKRASEEMDPMIGHWSEWTDDHNGNVELTAFKLTGRYEGDGIYECGRPNHLGNRARYEVALRPGDTIDGERTFRVSCPGDRLVLVESRLQTFIGRRIA
jgi:hypothetical protein